jgi:hypothetical protein
MEDRRLPPLMEYFSEVQDPRRETKNKKYPLIEVTVIAFLGVISGAENGPLAFHHTRCPPQTSAPIPENLAFSRY